MGSACIGNGAASPFNLGRSKHWTLDCGLDSGLDHGLDHGLEYGLDYGLEYNLHRDYRPTLVICLHLQFVYNFLNKEVKIMMLLRNISTSQYLKAT